jgi:hypothetical protein
MTMLKEPLLHFLLAGAALFAAYAWLDRGERTEQAGGEREVRITDAERHRMTCSARKPMPPPAPA